MRKSKFFSLFNFSPSWFSLAFVGSFPLQLFSVHCGNEVENWSQHWINSQVFQNTKPVKMLKKMNCWICEDYCKVIDVLVDPLGRRVLNLRLFLDTWFLLVNKSPQLTGARPRPAFFGRAPKCHKCIMDCLSRLNSQMQWEKNRFLDFLI